MKPAVRKLALIAHIALSVSWIGAAASVFALAITGLFSSDAQVARAAYIGTGVIWRFVLIPVSLTAVLSGLIQALGTPLGLFRHYWVLTKFALTVGAAAMLMLHSSTLLRQVDSLGGLGAVLPDAHNHLGTSSPQIHLVVAAGITVLLLLTVTALSVYKPWGKTRIGEKA